MAEQPVLIGSAVFDRVQRMLDPKTRRKLQESWNLAYLIWSTLRCGICGCRMISASTVRNGRLHRYYRCSTRDNQGEAVCPTV